MGNFDWQYVIDGAAALYGLYVLMSALKMKATGEISSFVASPEEMNKCGRISSGMRTLYHVSAEIQSRISWRLRWNENQKMHRKI